MTFDLPDATAVLERTPAVLSALLAGLPDRWIRSNEGGDTWSPFDIVGHMIDGEMTDWTARLRVIVEQGPNRRFEPFDRFRHKERNRNRTLPELLDEFRDLRTKNLAEVRALGLTPAQFALTGEHPSFGTVTLEQLLATWVVHDINHLAQIARVMARQYREAVGPWYAFLPVLHINRGRPGAESSVPTLVAADVARTARWYEQHLGFRIAGHVPDAEPYVYASVRQDHAEIMLLSSRPAEQAWTAYVRVNGARAVYERVRGQPFVKTALRQQPYGDWEFEVRDPDGHTIVFGGPE